MADYKTSNDPRFNVVNARNIRLNQKSLIGYSQIINSGAQAFLATTRTQLVNDALGTGTFLTARLWNPINNRLHLLDAQVGDYIDCHMVFPISGAIFLPSVIVELDFSPSLDGSQVIGIPQAVTNLTTTSGVEHDFQFRITAAMKANGIGVMVTTSAAMTITGAELDIQRFPTLTS